ncbi:MAG: DUF5685 family protein [Actinomycetales bacterium]
MRGLLRPCRHQFTDELHERWRAHLCGLCLTLRDGSGQLARCLTGYDVLLLSVLVEAQQGPLPRSDAGPCPLRGFLPASVIASDSAGAQLAAAGALLSGAAGLADKLADGDLPRGARGVAGRSGDRFRRDGARMAADVALADDVLDLAAAGALEVERRTEATLEELLAPTGAAVGELFAHTAVVAGLAPNADALRRAGDAFGRLVHLCDAIDDVVEDVASGHFNPLVATGTSATAAAELAEALRAEVVEALHGVEFRDSALVDVLLGPVLSAAVRQRQPVDPQRAEAGHDGQLEAGHDRRHASVPRPRVPVGSVAVVLVTALLGVFGQPPRRRRRGGYYPPGYDPGYGGYPPPYGYRRRYRSVGPSPCCCCELCACDCCLSSCCSSMTGDSVCCCCI